MGVVVWRYIHVDILILLIPTHSSCICSFLQQPYFLFIFLMFFVFVYTVVCNIFIITVYIHVYRKRENLCTKEIYAILHFLNKTQKNLYALLQKNSYHVNAARAARAERGKLHPQNYVF